MSNVHLPVSPCKPTGYRSVLQDLQVAKPCLFDHYVRWTTSGTSIWYSSLQVFGVYQAMVEANRTGQGMISPIFMWVHCTGWVTMHLSPKMLHMLVYRFCRTKVNYICRLSRASDHPRAWFPATVCRLKAKFTAVIGLQGAAKNPLKLFVIFWTTA